MIERETMQPLWFSLGAYILATISFLVGRHTAYVPSIFTTFLCFALPFRIQSFAKRKWTFFLLDFCYFANISAAAFLIFMPSSLVLEAFIYSLCDGPLAAAIVPWECAWVFGSPDHIVSVFIHILPGLAIFCNRYYASSSGVLPGWELIKGFVEHRVPPTALVTIKPWVHSVDSYIRSPPVIEGLPTSMDSWQERAMWLLAAPLCFYIAWQFLYLVVVQIVFGRMIISRGYETSYSSLARRSHRSSSPLHDFIRRGSKLRRVCMYGMIQLFYTLVTLVFGAAIYHSFELQLVWQIMKFMLPIYYGACYEHKRALPKATKKAATKLPKDSGPPHEPGTSPAEHAHGQGHQDVSSGSDQDSKPQDGAKPPRTPVVTAVSCAGAAGDQVSEGLFERGTAIAEEKVGLISAKRAKFIVNSAQQRLRPARDSLDAIMQFEQGFRQVELDFFDLGGFGSPTVSGASGGSAGEKKTTVELPFPPALFTSNPDTPARMTPPGKPVLIPNEESSTPEGQPTEGEDAAAAAAAAAVLSPGSKKPTIAELTAAQTVIDLTGEHTGSDGPRPGQSPVSARSRQRGSRARASVAMGGGEPALPTIMTPRTRASVRRSIAVYKQALIGSEVSLEHDDTAPARDVSIEGEEMTGEKLGLFSEGDGAVPSAVQVLGGITAAAESNITTRQGGSKPMMAAIILGVKREPESEIHMDSATLSPESQGQMRKSPRGVKMAARLSSATILASVVPKVPHVHGPAVSVNRARSPLTPTIPAVTTEQAQPGKSPSSGSRQRGAKTPSSTSRQTIGWGLGSAKAPTHAASRTEDLPVHTMSKAESPVGVVVLDHSSPVEKAGSPVVRVIKPARASRLPAPAKMERRPAAGKESGLEGSSVAESVAPTGKGKISMQLRSRQRASARANAQ